jgi:hypothetical protein
MMTLEDVILTKKKFTAMIEDLVRIKRMSYMDAVLQICSDREIDPLDVASLISPAIKDKIHAEAINGHLMKGGNKLPL